MRLDADGGRDRTHYGRIAALAIVLLGVTACRTNAPAPVAPASFLRIGFGLSTSPTGTSGMSQVAEGIVLDRVIAYGGDARGIPSIAERWSVSEDGKRIELQLRPGLLFHDGRPLTADSVRDALRSRLGRQVGPVLDDVTSIDSSGDNRVVLTLQRPSPLILEGLDVQVPAPGGGLIGSGPWLVDGDGESGGAIRLRANDAYYAGRPILDGIEIRPYATIRAAWADMLRGNVDMLYEVGADAIDSLRDSSATRLFTYSRRYVLVAILNMERRELQDVAVRRRLNAAVDRATLVKDVLHGLGMPAVGPVWPGHWAYDESFPGLSYDPGSLVSNQPLLRLRLVFADAAFERLVVFLQQQLRAANIELIPELVSLEEIGKRSQTGDFDVLLADAAGGPSLLRPYQFWHSKGLLNFGHFKSSAVDAALLHIRTAANEADFRKGVAAFQRAVVSDPPAIFLAWSERARAVSTRFEVVEEPGRDLMATLRLWKPAGTGLKAAPPN